MRTTIALLAAAAVSAVALGAPPAAQAEPPPLDFTRNGWYLQAQGVYAFENFDRFDVDDGAGLNVLGGWRFWRMFGMELETEYIDNFAGNGGDPDYRTFNFAVSGRAYPLARVFEPHSIFNRFQPWLKAGVSWMWVDPSGGGDRNRGDIAGRFGAGMDFYITQHWVLAVSGNYQLGGLDVSDYSYLSVGGGVQYRFGGRRR